MMITVKKFGGTSVGSVEALKRAANIILAGKGSTVVVVSAMSGITNFLVGAMDDRNSSDSEVFDKFEARHMEVAKALFKGERLEKFRKDFEIRFEAFKKVYSSKNDQKDSYFKDNVSSQGERFSSLVLAHLLCDMGADSVALTSEDAGVYAIGNPLSGTCDLYKTAMGMEINVKPLLARGCIPIITGFYGVNESGKPLTFGRGGSDYAAAAIGNAIDADCVEIWTDVDGFMSADPRIVPDAVSIEEMNFSEAAELAYFGAKVLHPKTIEPARAKQITVKILNSFHPDHPGTTIRSLRKRSGSLVKSVTMKNDLSVITIRSGEIAYNPRMVAKIIDNLGRHDVSVYGISTSLSTLAFIIQNVDVPRIIGELKMMRDEPIEGIDIKSNVALICVVGDDLLDKCGFSGDIFGAVKEAHVNVEMISEGASDVSLNFVVPAERATDVIRILHSKYVKKGSA